MNRDKEFAEMKKKINMKKPIKEINNCVFLKKFYLKKNKL